MSLKTGREGRARRTKMTTEKLYCTVGRGGPWSDCDLSLSDEGKDFLPQIIQRLNTGAEGKVSYMWVCENTPLSTCYRIYV